MVKSPSVNLWSSAEHALDYLRRADSIPHRVEGEATLLEFVPPKPKRILDLGTGAGRLLALVKAGRPNARFVGLDFSPTMLETASKLFSQDSNVTLVSHNLDHELPPLGAFDVVISSFAIHHLVHERKRTLYEEIFKILVPGGVFCNLEHVASASANLHARFLEAIEWRDEYPSNKLLDLDSQLVGFMDTDCQWKMARTGPARWHKGVASECSQLLIGARTGRPAQSFFMVRVYGQATG